MKNYFHRSSTHALIIGLILALSLYWMGEGGLYRPSLAEAKMTNETATADKEPVIFDGANPKIQGAIAAQERHHHRLMALPEVVGTATGVGEDEQPTILVFTKKRVWGGTFPESLEGVPVVAKLTGEIFAMKPKADARPKYSNTSMWPLPVPIGVSTGNIGECSAGTIGARVKGGGNVYALSNNHVYALENRAPGGSQVLQPGRYDTRCAYSGYNIIGSLHDFVPINFTAGATNTVDAAIALSSLGQLGNATPSGGYGKPNQLISAPYVRMPVQKYGRTSSLTKGTIYAINATINVGYETGTATFIKQIGVFSTRAFIKAGDSGSLLVTNDTNAYPVGLLFAGNGSGTYAFANPINLVLERFNVAIDGK